MEAIAAIADATELFPAEMLSDMIAGYLEGTRQDVWLTATRSGDPVGFAFSEPERLTNGTWNLLAIGVRPEQQGQGVGGRLVRHLEATLREGGNRVLLVETAGTPEYERTRAFYRANAFEEQARIREFYDVGIDKVVFWKRL